VGVWCGGVAWGCGVGVWRGAHPSNRTDHHKYTNRAKKMATPGELGVAIRSLTVMVF
jgi:hypothetical protein